MPPHGQHVADEAPHARASASCPQQCHVDTDVVARAADVNGLAVQRTLTTTQKPDVVNQARRAAEGTVVENGGQSGVEGPYAQAPGDERPIPGPPAQDREVGREADSRAAPIRRTEIANRAQRHAGGVLLHMAATIAADLGLESCTECVHHGHAPQVMRDVRVRRTPCGARVQSGHHRFEEGDVRLMGQGADRDSPAVVLDSDGTIVVERDAQVARVSFEVFVHAGADDLPQQMMQSGAVFGISDVHAGAPPHGFHAREHFDLTGSYPSTLVLLAGVASRRPSDHRSRARPATSPR